MAVATAGAVLLRAALWTAVAPGSLAQSEPAPVPIVGGEPTAPNEFETVVAIQAHLVLCTGILVSPTVVLTAAHCLDDLELGQTLQMFYGEDLDAFEPVEGVRAGYHPDFCSECGEDIFDYGFVETASPFTPLTGFVPPLVDQDEWDAAMVAGGDVTIVGYGEDPDTGGMTLGRGTKRKVTTEIEKFSDLGLEFFAGGDDKDSCPGDSGAPALVRVDGGAMRIAGVTSRGSDPCGGGGYYGTPFPALCWLRDETGVDLLEGMCCDCLDMTPPPEQDSGCAVGRPKVAASLLPLLVLACTRRRRR